MISIHAKQHFIRFIGFVGRFTFKKCSMIDAVVLCCANHLFRKPCHELVPTPYKGNAPNVTKVAKYKNARIDPITLFDLLFLLSKAFNNAKFGDVSRIFRRYKDVQGE